MGNPRAFLTIHRQEAGYRPVHERIDDFSEVEQTLNSGDTSNAGNCHQILVEGLILCFGTK